MSVLNIPENLAHPIYWPTWLAVAVGWLIAQLPYPVQYWIGHRLGDLLCLFRPKRVRVAQRNISACFPRLSAEQQKRMLRKNMRALGLGLFEILICRFGDLGILKNRFEIVGGENLEQQEESGVVLLVFHFSNIELCAAALYSRYPLLVVYRPHDNPVIEYTQRRRWSPAAVGLSELDRKSHLFDRADARGLVKALRQNKNIWIAADQDLGKKRCVFSSFFGIQTATPLAPAKLAAAGRAKVLPVTFTRPSKDKYRIEIRPALENYPIGEDLADADRFNQVAEEIIMKEPESYLWAHRRFKTRPQGEPDFYDNC